MWAICSIPWECLTIPCFFNKWSVSFTISQCYIRTYCKAALHCNWIFFLSPYVINSNRKIHLLYYIIAVLCLCSDTGASLQFSSVMSLNILADLVCIKPLWYGKKFPRVDQYREIQIVLLDLVSLLPLSARCILPRRGFLALRPSGMKMGLGHLSVLQRLL